MLHYGKSTTNIRRPGDLSQGQKIAEPDTELRCDFCKEVALDTYNEDHCGNEYYKIPVDHKTVTHNIIVDEKEFEALCKNI